jgi:hypothetical protein
MNARDERAWSIGYTNGQAGRLVFNDLWRPADAVERALCVSGFEAARITKGIGRYPVAVHHGRRRFWLVAPGTFNASGPDGQPPQGNSGYRDLRALFKLKGESA